MKKNIKLLNLREKDPYLEREGQRYDHPLPSREWIIKLLEQKGVPAKMEALARELSITDAEYEFFERRLKAMARDGQVLINRRGAVCVANKIDLVKCRVEAHKDGFGFAVPLQPTGDGDFILYERQMRGVMHGDIVTVRPAGVDRRGRREGTVLDIVERAQKQVVGRFYVERGIAILEAEDKRLTQSIVLEPDSVAGFKPESGQVVVAEMFDGGLLGKCSLRAQIGNRQRTLHCQTFAHNLAKQPGDRFIRQRAAVQILNPAQNGDFPFRTVHRACPFQFADSMRMTGALIEQTEDFRIDAVDGIAVRQ